MRDRLMVGQFSEGRVGCAIVNPYDSPTAFPEFEGPATVVEIVARLALGAACPGYYQVVPFRDTNVYRVDGRRRIAERLRPEPVSVDVQRMYVVGPTD